jgi:hypothetical protein
MRGQKDFDAQEKMFLTGQKMLHEAVDELMMCSEHPKNTIRLNSEECHALLSKIDEPLVRDTYIARYGHTSLRMFSIEKAGQLRLARVEIDG